MLQQPEVAGSGEYNIGLLCGVEDRNLQNDGYNAMCYGYDRALECVQEFIDNGKGVGDWSFDAKTGRATVRVTWPNNEMRTYTYELDK